MCVCVVLYKNKAQKYELSFTKGGSEVCVLTLALKDLSCFLPEALLHQVSQHLLCTKPVVLG